MVLPHSVLPSQCFLVRWAMEVSAIIFRGEHAETAEKKKLKGKNCEGKGTLKKGDKIGEVPTL